MTAADKFIRLLKHPVKYRVFLFFKLPSAFFAGVRIKDVAADKCVVTVPYKWFSQNPFRSTYFACLAMAAEMSTGSLAMVHLQGRTPAVSMLVTRLEAGYFKKATGITTFVCADGLLLQQTIEKAIATGEPQSFAARSIGSNANGELVAEFVITWSFKQRLAQI